MKTEASAMDPETVVEVPRNSDMPLGGGGVEERVRVVLHVDCDHFFLQVHQRADPRIAQETYGRPCALYQYSDVICANAGAKEAGVKKHHRPHEAQALLEPLGGRLLHAYWRKWPGKRVVATPYQVASKEFFESIDRFFTAKYPDCTFVVEHSSIDECYIDCTEFSFGLIDRGEQLAQTLRQHLLEESDFRVSIGVSFNRLLAKMASAQAKKDASAYKIKTVVPATCNDFLRSLPASKLPGLGQKKREIRQMQDSGQLQGSDCEMSIAGLQAFTAAQLRQRLNLKSDALARQVWDKCRGSCTLEVAPVSPPKRLGATSWFANGRLGLLARKERVEAGSTPVVVGAGQWVFEPHHGRTKNNPGPRWILLGLALDLAERIDHHHRARGEVPTALSVVLTRKDAALSTFSRSGKLPASLVALFGSGEAQRRFSETWSRRRECDGGALRVEGIAISEEHSALQCDAEEAKPGDDLHMRCAAGIVDAAAALVQELSTEHGEHAPVLRLALCGTHLARVGGPRSLAGWLARGGSSGPPHGEPSSAAAAAASGRGEGAASGGQAAVGAMRDREAQAPGVPARRPRADAEAGDAGAGGGEGSRKRQRPGGIEAFLTRTAAR